MQREPDHATSQNKNARLAPAGVSAGTLHEACGGMRGTLGRTSALRHEMPARYDQPHAGSGRGRAFIHSISLRAPCSGRACGGAGRCIKVHACVHACRARHRPEAAGALQHHPKMQCTVNVQNGSRVSHRLDTAAGPDQGHTSSLAVAQTPQPNVTLPSPLPP